jgi:DNA replication licensing factor MCM6
LDWERRAHRFDEFANFQDNYLLEIRGDVNSSLDPSNPQDETMDDETAADSNKVYYVVHPQVDLSDLSSSLPGV